MIPGGNVKRLGRIIFLIAKLLQLTRKPSEASTEAALQRYSDELAGELAAGLEDNHGPR